MISIHAAREGGDRIKQYMFGKTEISIHAAREGGDETCENITYDANDFNPRRP